MNKILKGTTVKENLVLSWAKWHAGIQFSEKLYSFLPTATFTEKFISLNKATPTGGNLIFQAQL